MTGDAMLQEAIQAVKEGDKARARDLLTRLLRQDQNQPEYWYWMSAAVETQKEQVFCLQNLLRLEPENLTARRGLVMLGAREADDSIQPNPQERPKKWQARSLVNPKPRLSGKKLLTAFIRLFIFFGMVVLVAWLAWLGYTGNLFKPAAQSPFAFQLTATGITYATLTPLPTSTPTVTPLFARSTPTPPQPKFPDLKLAVPYTSTPLFVVTQHPETEAYRIGFEAFNNNDWPACISFMEQAIQVSGELPDLYYYIAESNYQLGYYSQALAAFNHALELDDRFGPAYVGRARVRLAYSQASGIDLDTAGVEGDLTNAKKYSPKFADAFLESARYWLENDPTKALEDLAQAESLAPQSPLVYLFRAQAYLHLEDFTLAGEQARKALDLDTTLLDAYFFLAEAEWKLGNLEEAIKNLEIYSHYNPGEEADLDLIEAYLQAGHGQAALDTLGPIFASGPTPQAYWLRSRAYLLLGQPEMAIKDALEAHLLQRSSFEYSLALGHAFMAAGDFSNAFGRYGETLDLARSTEQKALVYYYRAESLVKLEEYKGAWNDLNRFFELPENSAPLEITSQAENLLNLVNQHLVPVEEPTNTSTP